MGGTCFGDLHRFDRVDEAADRDQFVRFLERIDALPDVRQRRRFSYELLGVRPGSRIVDVGCGLGTVLAELAELGAEPIGVDVSEEMVRHATKRVPGAMVMLGDAGSLPLEGASVVGYRAERVYQHLAAPDLALVEARRVLREGGRIVLVDQDWDAFTIDSDDPTLTRAILRSFTDSLLDGRAGLGHRARLLDAGFSEVAVHAEAHAIERFETLRPALAGIASAASSAVGTDATNLWLGNLEQRANEGRFLALMTHVVASATRG